MQLARLLWPLNTRTPVGKLRQVMRAHRTRTVLFESTTFSRPISTTRRMDATSKASARRALSISTSRSRTLSLPEALTLAVIPQDPAAAACARASTDNADVINSRLTDARAPPLCRRWLVDHPQDAALKPLFDVAAEHSPFAGASAVRGAACRRSKSLLTERMRSANLPSAHDIRRSISDLQRLFERQIAAHVARNARPRHPQRLGHPGRHARHGHQGAGRIGRLLRCRDCRARSTARWRSARRARR